MKRCEFITLLAARRWQGRSQRGRPRAQLMRRSVVNVSADDAERQSPAALLRGPSTWVSQTAADEPREA